MARLVRASFKSRDVFASSDSVKDHLRLQAPPGLVQDVFAVMYLDSQNRLIDYGTD